MLATSAAIPDDVLKDDFSGFVVEWSKLAQDAGLEIGQRYAGDGVFGCHVVSSANAHTIAPEVPCPLDRIANT